MADEVFDTLGQFPAPEVKVLVQVVSVCIGDSCLVSVRKYIKSLIICYLLLYDWIITNLWRSTLAKAGNKSLF